MKVKPKEVLLNLPVALLFDEPWEIAAFAANINTVLHGKVRLKLEELGMLGGKHVGLFYLQRNNESQQIRDEFVRLIEQEEIEARGFVPEPETTEENLSDVVEDLHVLCFSCDRYAMLHQKGEEHCWCGDSWINGKCESLRADK